MRTKDEIMKDATCKQIFISGKLQSFETLEEKHSYLMVEIACDRRDEEAKHHDRMESRWNFAVRVR